MILAWGTSRDSKHIFWLNGMAGTGKSTISRTVSKLFAEHNILGGSFFFKRGEGDRDRAVLFFPTIITQLIHRLPSLAPIVREEIEANPFIQEESLQDQFDKLIAKPIQRLPEELQPLIIVIVVDALDECNDLRHMKLLIQLLSKSKDLKSISLKFFLTSRPELLIHMGFNCIEGAYNNAILHEISEPIIRQDIALFLRKELARIRDDYNTSVLTSRQLPPDWPSGDIEELVEVANPLFISAATICHFIEDRRLGSPRDQLARVLNHQSERSKLETTYLPVLERLLEGLIEPERLEVIERFRQIVGSIVLLASPLSMTGLSRLLGTSYDILAAHLDMLQSVLLIPPSPHSPVRLLHKSFRDFLVQENKSQDTAKHAFSIDARETNRRLAVHCLQLLSASATLKKDICNLRLPGKCRSQIDKHIINNILLPEIQYACLYWVYHYKESKIQIQDGDIVDNFLNSHLLFWLEALGLLARSTDSVGMINDLRDLLNVCFP